MLSEWLRDHTVWLVDPAAKAIGRLGISPNWITLLGLIANAAVALLIARGYLRIGGALTLVVSLFDTLDGALARALGQVNSFGAFLDSTLDRLSEAVVYLGLLLYYAQLGQRQEMVLIYAAIVGSLMVSYARARAEGLGLQCKVGILTRAERVGLLTIGLMAGIMPWMLWALVILTNVTVAQRVFHVWRATRRVEQQAAAGVE